MERISIGLLREGMQLDQPLYNRDGILLLQTGRVLTRDMLRALMRSPHASLYIGDWHSDELHGEDGESPIQPSEKIVQQFERTLETQLEKELDPASLETRPKGKPFAESANMELVSHRPEKQREEWHFRRKQGVSFIGNVFKGQVPPDYLNEEAERVIADIMDAYCIDRDYLLNMISLKNGAYYLYAHSFNVAVLTVHIASALKYNREQVLEAGVAGLLHDIGMQLVPRELVAQPRVLSQDEYFDVQKHSTHALYLLDRMTHLPWSTRYIVYQMHERPNGEGYPKRREKKLIHPFARIAAAADVYDALTAPRPWRKAAAPYKAMEQMLRGVPKGLYDGDAVRGLLQYLSLFPIGSMVHLSNGEIARVIHANIGNYSKPVVKVLFSPSSTACHAGNVINLLDEDTLRIESFADGYDVPIEAGF